MASPRLTEGHIEDIVQHCSLSNDLRLPSRMSKTEATNQDKLNYLKALLQHDPGVFLERHGALITKKQRVFFEPLRDDYEVNYYIMVLEDSDKATGADGQRVKDFPERHRGTSTPFLPCSTESHATCKFLLMIALLISVSFATDSRCSPFDVAAQIDCALYCTEAVVHSTAMSMVHVLVILVSSPSLSCMHSRPLIYCVSADNISDSKSQEQKTGENGAFGQAGIL